eukprot:gene29285-38355_t
MNAHWSREYLRKLQAVTSSSFSQQPLFLGCRQRRHLMRHHISHNQPSDVFLMKLMISEKEFGGNFSNKYENTRA